MQGGIAQSYRTSERGRALAELEFWNEVSRYTDIRVLEWSCE